jgi:hypothetical protein
MPGSSDTYAVVGGAAIRLGRVFEEAAAADPASDVDD